MRKRIIALLTCVMLIAALCIVPDVDAGKSTFNITNQTRSVAVGKSFNIKLNGIKAKKVKWSSSKTSVATVSKNGVVTGVKKGKATITGKYKSIKFKIKVDVYKGDNGTCNLNDLTVKYKGTKTYTSDNEYLWAVTFTFSNKSEIPSYMAYEFYQTCYINNVEKDYEYENNYYTKVKNGASTDVTFEYLVKSGDNVELSLYYYNNDDEKVIFYETETKIK